ncbi:hypothetical protein AX16_007878 [Volvariella volvacea WC 439]|nr:hypothetical protein AX16_007878 [Volvariella volvacea WC 439]
MPPAKGSKVPAKTGGKDIRTFFGGRPRAPRPSQPLPSTQQKESGPPSQPTVGNASETNKERIASAQKLSTQLSASRKPVTMDDSDDEPITRKPVTHNKRKVVSSDEEDEAAKPPPKKAAVSPHRAKATTPKSKQTPKVQGASKKKKKDEDDFIVDDDDENSSSAKEDESDSSEELIPKKRPPPKRKPAPPKPVAKGESAGLKSNVEAKQSERVKEKAEAQEDKIDKKKFNWAAAKAAKMAPPPAHGSKAIPDGEPDCLAGLSFVFTGELSSLSRDEAVDLAKRFGGRVVGNPSSKTSYVIVGDNAGPRKLAALKKHNIKTLDEDGFLNLIAIRKGSGQLDEKTKKKMEKEQQDIKQAAKKMSQREAAAVKASGEKAMDVSSQLWTVRYAPQNLKEICGNKSQVEKLHQWLVDWSASMKANFKKPGKTGMNVYRAVLIYGLPGIGKTTSAHLCAKLAGFTPIELNASDTRSKRLVENGMNVNNTSLDGFLKGGHAKNSLGVEITNRSCLIMDEVDGMSAGDRGGVGALNAMIKKTKIPIICIANDGQAQKLKPLMSTTYKLSFHKPQAATIRSRLMTIAYKEKLKIPANVLDQLVQSAQSDIRQVLNMMSTWKLSKDSMDFDEGKALAKMNEKYSIMSPFDITSKMLGPYLYSATARETLGDKMELYFQDHAFMPLFIQENYLKTQPARLRGFEGPEKSLKELEIMDKAASSISDADLIDTLIHGPEQHWSLMPAHACCSAVRPASYMYGGGAHYGGQNPISFPQWLGQNSKQNKLAHQLGDIQVRMRLKVSGDKTEIRQSYLPALFSHVVKPLIDTGASAVDEVIERMDDYFISKEDWDALIELGVGDHKDEVVVKKISTATKTALTRKYNSMEHPIPFHRAEDLGKAAKRLPGGPAPDVEDAFEADDIPEEASDDENSPSGKDDNDVLGDKLIQAPKKKKSGASAGSGMKAKGKVKAVP